MAPALGRLASCLLCVSAGAARTGLEDGASLVQQAALSGPALLAPATRERPGGSGREEEPLSLLDVSHVRDPRPASVEEMRSISPAERNMFEYRVKDDLIFYGFNTTKDKAISATLARGELWQAHDSEEFCRVFETAEGRADFLDLGANIGTWALPVARCLKSLGRGGRVIAVEAVPLIAEHLEASVVRNNLTDVVDVYNYAAGGYNVSADGAFVEAPDEVLINQHAANKGASSILRAGKDKKWVKTRMTTVDSILERHPARVFGAKVDVEGFEGFVLRGAQQLLANPPCILNIEVNTGWLRDAGTPWLEVLDVLQKAGYQPLPPPDYAGMMTETFYQQDMDACKARFQ